MLKITVAQLNYTVGDIEGNAARMIAAARQAAVEGAALVVFSELSLTGYYPGDLLDEPGFIARVALGLDSLQQASRQLPELHATPILLLSAKADEALVTKLLDNGAQDFIVKPFSEKNLLVRVVLRPFDRTLTDAEANTLRDRVYAGLHRGRVMTWAS